MQLMYTLYLPVQKLYLFALKSFSHFSETILTLLKNIYLYGTAMYMGNGANILVSNKNNVK